MASRYSELSICRGSPYEKTLYWPSGLTPSWVGCSAATFSDHTAQTELGWWEQRAREEGVLRGWLGVLPWLITTDAQARALDEFVRRRYDGKIEWIEGNPKDPKDRVYRNAYTMVLLDPSIVVPEPALSKAFAKGLARATKNFLAVFPNISARILKKRVKPALAWRTYKDAPVGHTPPARTPEMDAALKDMKAKYEDVWGPNLEFSKYWIVSSGILNTNYLGCPYQEADGRRGCSLYDMPFDLQDLYFFDYAFVIHPQERLSRFLDLFAPGWSAGAPKPVFQETLKDTIGKIGFGFTKKQDQKPSQKAGGAPSSQTKETVTSSASMVGLAAGAVGLAAIGYLALRSRG